MEHPMKIKPAKLAFLLLLVVSSICSYIYLNTYQTLNSTRVVEEMEEQTLEEEAPREEVFLPDVRLIKKIVSGAHRLIPS